VPRTWLIVTGAVSPAINGNYTPIANFGGKAAYKNTVVNYYIAWLGVASVWVLSSLEGNPSGSYWLHFNATPLGTYTGYDGASGTVTVS
jgi:hypothetical protein